MLVLGLGARGFLQRGNHSKVLQRGYTSGVHFVSLYFSETLIQGLVEVLKLQGV